MVNDFDSVASDWFYHASCHVARVMEEALDGCGRPDILAPYRDEYSFRAGPDIVAETRLRVANGVYVTVGVPYSDEPSAARQVEQLREGLKQLLSQVEGALALRERISKQVTRMAARLVRNGLEVRILDVRLSTVRLGRHPRPLDVTVEIEGGTCNMLRPFQDEWRVESEADLDDRMKELERLLRPRAARKATLPVGAIGFIDSVALTLVDSWPEGREEVIRRIMRRYEYRTYLERPEDRSKAVGLEWLDGVIRVYADVVPGVEREWDKLRFAQDVMSTVVVGQPVTELVPHPAMDGLLIEEVLDEKQGRVRITDRLVPVAADGRLLM